MKEIIYSWAIFGCLVLLGWPTHSQGQFRYNLLKPDKIILLKKELKEVSGLSYLKTGKLACVQDEKGKIYIVNPQDGKITQSYNFAKDGDFEGIEIIHNTAYVLRSDGKIYEINNFQKSNASKEEYKTFLEQENDTEGLAYDANTQALWIACKADAFKKDSPKYIKAIYSFDLLTKKLDKQPLFVLNLRQLGSGANAVTQFEPSALAVHPQTGNVYILASAGKRLLVLNRSGSVIENWALNKKIFAQPEGICFDSQANLYIANEGQSSEANILVFNIKK